MLRRMELDHHRVVGLYPSQEAAESARVLVIDGGVTPAQLTLQVPGSVPTGEDALADSDDVLKDVLRDGAIGTAVGTATGAVGSIAMAAANITLFVANPLLGALYLLGWGASLGGLVGAVVGSERSKGDVSNLIRDALAVGQFVLIVHTTSEDETALVRRIVGGSMAAMKGGKAEVAVPLALQP